MKGHSTAVLWLVGVAAVAVLVGEAHAVQTRAKEWDSTAPMTPYQVPAFVETLATTKCVKCNISRIMENSTVKAVMWSARDRRRFRHNPGQKTKNILEMLKKLKLEYKPSKDPVPRDIKKIQHLLAMSEMLKTKLKSYLKKTTGKVPELPSEEKLFVDATGAKWGEAEYHDRLQEMFKRHNEKNRQERLKLKAEEKAEGRNSNNLDNKKKPGATMTREVLKDKAKELGFRKSGKAPAKQQPSPFAGAAGSTVTQCAGAGCPAPKAPLAPDGTPSGLGRAEKARVGPLLQASPSCPCGCPATQCPCKCAASTLVSNTAQQKAAAPAPPVALVPKLPKVEATQVTFQKPGKPTAPTAKPRFEETGTKADSDCHPPLCFAG